MNFKDIDWPFFIATVSKLYVAANLGSIEVLNKTVIIIKMHSPPAHYEILKAYANMVSRLHGCCYLVD